MLQRFEYTRRPVLDQGTLDEMSMAEVLHSCRQHQVDGVLRLRSAPTEKNIIVVHGHPTFVESNVRSETLAEYLRNQGRIDNEAGQIIHELVRQTGRRQQDLLLARGLLDNHQLYEVLVEHVVQKTVDCFSWNHGEFDLLPNNEPSGAGLRLKLDVTRMILDGVQQYFGEARLAPLPELPWEARAYVRNEALEQIGQLALTTAEARMRDLVTRNLTLDEIITTSRRNRLAVLRLLYAFYVQELVGFELRKFYSTAPPLTCEETTDTPAGGVPAATRTPPPRPAATRTPPPRPARTETEEDPEAAIRRDYQQLKGADYFTLLGIDRSASEKEIHHAFRERSQQYEPRIVAAYPREVREKAGELFVRLVTGYRLLTNRANRERYAARLEKTGTPAPHDDRRRRTSLPPGIEPVALARKAIDEEDYNHAIDVLREALRQRPNDGKTLAWLGWALYLSDKRLHRRETVRLMEGARKAAPDRPEPYHFMALILEHEGARDRARQLAEAAANFGKKDLEIAREAHLFAVRLRHRRTSRTSTSSTPPVPVSGIPRLESPDRGCSPADQSALNQDVGEMLSRFLSRVKTTDRD
jgi:curved DNA-binding protein CbpA